MNENQIRQIVRRVLIESVDNELECVRSVNDLLQTAKSSLNKALQKLTYSNDYDSKTYESIRQLHNAISSIQNGEHLHQ